MDKNLRNKMWNNLIDLHASYTGPWLVAGDFNDVLGANEKIGDKTINSKHSKLQWDCINSCNLVDLVFKGCKFTWSNHRKKNNGLIMERLDKVFTNDEWISLFPKTTVTHLPKTHSDHNPLLIEIIPPKKLFNSKTFQVRNLLV